ncbi:hypothetical protein BC832DRAFT_540426 [Gaertneriomyces semiglobifer]|nr:hypothetical protein BC832DRAFT_540426 [Gaertneriomyces semiglobifer]
MGVNVRMGEKYPDGGRKHRFGVPGGLHLAVPSTLYSSLQIRIPAMTPHTTPIIDGNLHVLPPDQNTDSREVPRWRQEAHIWCSWRTPPRSTFHTFFVTRGTSAPRDAAFSLSPQGAKWFYNQRARDLAIAAVVHYFDLRILAADLVVRLEGEHPASAKAVTLDGLLGGDRELTSYTRTKEDIQAEKENVAVDCLIEWRKLPEDRMMIVFLARELRGNLPRTMVKCCVHRNMTSRGRKTEVARVSTFAISTFSTPESVDLQWRLSLWARLLAPALIWLSSFALKGTGARQPLKSPSFSVDNWYMSDGISVQYWLKEISLAYIRISRKDLWPVYLTCRQRVRNLCKQWHSSDETQIGPTIALLPASLPINKLTLAKEKFWRVAADSKEAHLRYYRVYLQEIDEFAPRGNPTPTVNLPDYWGDGKPTVYNLACTLLNC